eukprot:SAG11_NODE_1439_length_4907_cov_2.082571_4_plen_314_part_00
MGKKTAKVAKSAEASPAPLVAIGGGREAIGDMRGRASLAAALDHNSSLQDIMGDLFDDSFSLTRSPAVGGTSQTHWEADGVAQACRGCSTTFTVTNRRHHCRPCGGVFCGGCSAFRVRGERACKACFDHATPAGAYDGLHETFTPRDGRVQVADGGGAAQIQIQVQPQGKPPKGEAKKAAKAEKAAQKEAAKAQRQQATLARKAAAAEQSAARAAAHWQQKTQGKSKKDGKKLPAAPSVMMGVGARMVTKCNAPYFALHEKDTDVLGVLNPGVVIEVLESKMDSFGRSKVRHVRGWTPVLTPNDQLVLGAPPA